MCGFFLLLHSTLSLSFLLESLILFLIFFFEEKHSMKYGKIINCVYFAQSLFLAKNGRATMIKNKLITGRRKKIQFQLPLTARKWKFRYEFVVFSAVVVVIAISISFGMLFFHSSRSYNLDQFLFRIFLPDDCRRPHFEFESLGGGRPTDRLTKFIGNCNEPVRNYGFCHH